MKKTAHVPQQYFCARNLSMSKIKLALLAFLLQQFGISYAQEHTTIVTDTMKINLSELWEKTEQYSKVIGLKYADVGIAEEEVKDAITERFPELGISGSAEKASNIPIYKNGLFEKPVQHEVIHTLYKASVDLYLAIYHGNKINLEIKQQHILSHLAGIEKAQTSSRMRLEATKLFLDLQKSSIFRQLVLVDIHNQEKQLAEVKALHRNGTVLQSDVLRIELDLSRRKLLLVEIQNDIQIITQKLNIIIGEPDERPLLPTAVSSTNDLDTLTYDQLVSLALEHAYPYHMSHQQTELSKIKLKKAQANGRPTIGLYSEFYYANPQIFLFPYNPYWYSLGIAGVRGSFPISSLYHNKHNVDAARLELHKEELAHHEVEDRVRQKVKEAYLRYKEALVQIQVAEVNVEQAAENARIIRDTYFHHTSLVTDLLDADIQVLRSNFELASARILAQNRYFSLKDIVGIL